MMHEQTASNTQNISSWCDERDGDVDRPRGRRSDVARVLEMLAGEPTVKLAKNEPAVEPDEDKSASVLSRFTALAQGIWVHSRSVPRLYWLFHRIFHRTEEAKEDGTVGHNRSRDRRRRTHLRSLLQPAPWTYTFLRSVLLISSP